MSYMKYPYLLLVLLFLGSGLFAQDEELEYENRIYAENISSVRFHPAGIFLSYPILDLNTNAQLVLSFDDLDDEVKNYTYTVEHCDADWTPSDLRPTEYIDGFSEETIDEFQFSFNTIVPFTNYFFRIPNESFRLTKSGNYLLKVYEDEDQKRLVITRRFMVVDPAMRIEANAVRPSMVNKADTHQEIDFKVTFEGFDIRNPLIEVKAVIMQNGRWDNAVVDLPPQFTRQQELIYDYQNRIVFPAGKEFRALDLRSLRYPSQNILAVEAYPDATDVTLLKDRKRVNQTYLEVRDLNGKFVMETQDGQDHDLETDYANVLFSLYSPTEFADQDVYVYGGLTDWQLKPSARMIYNPRINSYVSELFLKQGYYDYWYVTVPREGGLLQLSDTEGNWFETENEYTILIYYRPFGQRYDRLVASHTFSTRP